MKSGSAYRAALEKSGHRPPEKPIGIPHLQQVPVFRLSENAEIDGRDVLIPCVANGGTILHEFQDGKLLLHLGWKLF